MNVTKYNKMCDAELEIISGGGKVGAAFGVTAFPGAFVGAHVGAVAGGLACIGASF